MLLGATGLRALHNTRTDIAVSNDGRSLAYLNNRSGFQELVIKDIKVTNNISTLGRLSTAQGSGLLFFSQDDEWLHFIDAGKLSRVRVEGGAFQVILNDVAVARSGYTSFEEKIFFTNAADGQLYSLPVSRGQPEAIQVMSSDAESRAFSWPRVLPGNTHLLVTSSISAEQVGIGNIKVLNIETGDTSTLIQTASNATYLPSGHIIFVRDASLWAVPFDLRNREIIGAQVPVVQGIETNSQLGHAAYAVSQDGRLFYLPGNDVGGNSGQNQLTWVDKNGRIEVEATDRAFGHMSLSPNENRLAVTVYEDTGGSDIWVWDLNRKTLGRRTSGGEGSRSIWSPDGRMLIYSHGVEGLRAVASNGTEQPIPLLSSSTPAVPTSVSTTGEVVFGVGAPFRLYTLNLQSIEEQETIATELAVALEPPRWHGSQISPDGNWIAYVSNETGENQIYVRPFPEINGGKWQASTVPGMQPIWHPTDDILFYELQGGQQYSNPYEVDRSDPDNSPSVINFGAPEEMFSRPTLKNPTTIPAWVYSASEDRFLILEQPGVGTSTEDEVLQAQTNLIVVDDWYPEVQSLTPATVQ